MVTLLGYEPWKLCPRKKLDLFRPFNLAGDWVRFDQDNTTGSSRQQHRHISKPERAFPHSVSHVGGQDRKPK
ncbi:rCG38115 [Rattus norvegicus]|uniref:RCG38115 n=1 Tax=Rattus norvegicus TaxID=10116 RepID=A6IUZ9_RAT|nr:rCG38115 [Rattus norvegicus]